MIATNHRIRAFLSFVFALVFLPGLGACGDSVEDFVDVQGTYGNGSPLTLHEQLQRVQCDSSKTPAPCLTLKALRLVDPSATALRGIRIDYSPSMVSRQTAYPSGLLEPVTVYAIRYGADAVTHTTGFVDSSIEGDITFSQMASGPGEMTVGTFDNMVLQQADMNGEQQTVFSLAHGSFQYLQP